MICRRCEGKDKEFRKNRKVCRDCEREASRKRSFKLIRGITTEERDLILALQGYKCSCCGKKDPGSLKGWHADHSHSEGHIRGILCANCNIALGQVNDSVKHLQLLIEYLQRATTISKESTPKRVKAVGSSNEDDDIVCS